MAQTAYVADSRNGTGAEVTPVSLPGLAAASAISGGSIYGLSGAVVDPTGTYFYMADYNVATGTINRIKISNGAVTSLTISGESSRMGTIGISPDGANLYTSDGTYVYQIPLPSFSTYNSLSLSVSPEVQAWAFDSSGNAYAVMNSVSSIAKISISTFTQVGSALSLSHTPYTVTIDPTSTYLYVGCSGYVAKITLSSFTVNSYLGISGASDYQIAMDPNGNYLYVPLYNSGIARVTLSSFTSTTQTLTASWCLAAIVDPTNTYIYIGCYKSGVWSLGQISVAAFSSGDTAWTALSGYFPTSISIYSPSSLPPRPKGLPAAVRRANNYFKRESGLWEPERGFVVPRAA